MLIEIIRHTPAPIWILLAALIALGANQLRDREVGRTRLKVLPVVLAVLSATGLFRDFGGSALALGAWSAGLCAAWAIGRNLFTAPIAVGPAPKALVRVPGSAWPLVLIVGLFAIRYTTGVALALHPELTHDLRFVGAASLACGVFGGLFLVRAGAAGRSAGAGSALRSA